MPRIATDAKIPYIDPDVEHVGVTKLREWNAQSLRHLEKTFVIQDKDTPLAVLLGYEQYLIIQDKLQSVMETVEILTSEQETGLLVSGIQEMREGHTTSLEEIRRSLKREK